MDTDIGFSVSVSVNRTGFRFRLTGQRWSDHDGGDKFMFYFISEANATYLGHNLVSKFYTI